MQTNKSRAEKEQLVKDLIGRDSGNLAAQAVINTKTIIDLSANLPLTSIARNAQLAQDSERAQMRQAAHISQTHGEGLVTVFTALQQSQLSGVKRQPKVTPPPHHTELPCLARCHI